MDNLRGHFDEYAAAFSDYDEERLVSFFHVPCLMVNASSVVLLPDTEAVQASIRGLLRYHRDEGVELARVQDFSTVFLGASLALAHVEWLVHRVGLSAWEFRNSYNLVSQGEGWKIVASTTHEAAA